MSNIIAYIDGFNFYYGAVKNTHYKWLDFNALLNRMFPQHNIIGIKYFTAPVAARKGDLNQPMRQQIYWRALRTIPNFEIIRGTFLTNQKNIALARAEKYPVRARIASLLCPDIVRNRDGVYLARVIKTEEKGSDVNLASHLINDAHSGRFQEGIVVSGDSDLCDAVRIVVQEVGLPVCVVNPQSRTSRALSQLASHYRHIHGNDLAQSQFPNVMTDVHGNFTKPASW